MMAIMYGGCIIEFGSTKCFCQSPSPLYKFLLSSIPKIGDKTEKNRSQEPVSLTNPPPGCSFAQDALEVKCVPIPDLNCLILILNSTMLHVGYTGNPFFYRLIYSYILDRLKEK